MKRRFECNAPLSFDSGFSIQKTGLIQDDAPFLYAVINKTYSYSELFVRCIDCLTGGCQWQGEIVNILLKIKNSFLPTKQILIGL
ncbi:hypothetical protein ACV1CZ_12795, partial [Aeromonas caviae]